MSLTVLRENIIKIAVIGGLLIVLIALSFPVINAARELGSDTKFGKLLVVSIPSVVDQSRPIKYTMSLKDKKSFGRLGNVAQVGQGKISLSQGKKVAKALGIKGNPKKVVGLQGQGEKYVWQVGGKVLTIPVETGEINYSNSNTIPEVGVKYTSDVRGVAEDFLKKSGLLGELKVRQEIPVEIKGVLSLKNTGYSNGAEVLFTKEYNGHEIITQGWAGYVSIVVGYDQRIRKFSYLSPAKILDEGVYPVISAGDAINKLKANEAIVYKVYIDGLSSLINNVTLNSIDVTEMKTVYIDSSAGKYLKPYYVFKGKATTTEDKEVEVSLLVNAIKAKYLEIQ